LQITPHAFASAAFCIKCVLVCERKLLGEKWLPANRERKWEKYAARGDACTEKVRDSALSYSRKFHF
jgi:hypothetical protein